MAGHGGLALQVDTDEVKGQAAFFVPGFRDDSQAQGDQLGHQAALGGFDLAPTLGVFRDGQVGDRPVEGARSAQGAAVGVGDHPVASRRGVEVGAAAEQARVGVGVQLPALWVGAGLEG